MAKTKYVDLAGLQVFKGLIEGKISDGDAKSFKTILLDEARKTASFYKKENATEEDTADFTINIPIEQDLSGYLEVLRNATVGNIVTVADENGKIGDSGIAVANIATKAEVKVNTDAIAVLNGTGEGSVNKKVADAVATIVSEAPESYDTLKEISDWISSHSSDASAMNSQINTNKTDITSLKTLVGDGFEVITEDEINALFT